MAIATNIITGGTFFGPVTVSSQDIQIDRNDYRAVNTVRIRSDAGSTTIIQKAKPAQYEKFHKELCALQNRPDISKREYDAILSLLFVIHSEDESLIRAQISFFPDVFRGVFFMESASRELMDFVWSMMDGKEKK